MMDRSFCLHLISVWVASFAATIWWRIAHAVFIVPAYLRSQREGGEWPAFGLYTVDITIDWETNYHVWRIAAVVVSLALVVGLRESSAQKPITRAAHFLSYLYLTALTVVSACVGVVSTW